MVHLWVSPADRPVITYLPSCTMLLLESLEDLTELPLFEHPLQWTKNTTRFLRMKNRNVNSVVGTLPSSPLNPFSINCVRLLKIF